MRRNANIKLKAGNEVKNTITLSGDNTWIETSSADKGTININHKEKSYNNTSNGNLTGDKKTLTSQGTFDVITGIGYDNAGHIDSVTTSTMEMPEINYSLDEVTTTVGNNTVTTGIQLKNGNKITLSTNSIPLRSCQKVLPKSFLEISDNIFSP